MLAAACVLVLPGLLVALAAGLRGNAALGMASPLSVTTVALTAVVCELVGVPFGVPAVAVATTAAAAAVLLAARLLPAGRTRATARLQTGHLGTGHLGTRHLGSERFATASGIAGAAIGGTCAAVAVVRGIGRPEVFPQTFDALFHLSAVWRVLHTGDASSLTLGSVSAPGHSAAFYPAAWHDVVALVAQVSGAHVVVAVNCVSIAIATVVWPLGCVFLARQLVGDRPGVLFAAGVLSAAFGASPYLLLSYGTLWPNALANALLPSVLACGVAVLLPRSPRDLDGLDGMRALALGAATLPGVALAHPNAVPSAMLYLTVMALAALGRWGLGDGAGPRRRLTAAGAASALVGADLWFVAFSPVFAATRGTSWPARQTLAQAAGEWALAAPMRSPVPWLAATLVLLGCAVASRKPRLRWLVLAHAAAGAAFVLVSGSDGRLARALSGPWYDDSFRFAGLLGITAVPLAAVGLEWCATAGVIAVGRATPRARRLTPQAVVGPMALVLAALTMGMYAGANGRVVGNWYHGQSLAGPAERSMLVRLPQLVPSDVRIAGNPWNGSPLAAPLGNRATVFPHVGGAWDPDRLLLAKSLNEAAESPAVCAAVHRLDVSYVIDGPIEFWKGDRRQTRYPGLEVEGHPGFVPVASGGD